MKHWKIGAFFIGILILPTPFIFAKEPGTSVGLTLLRPPSARAAGLADAFSAVTDDVSGLAYNPASLGSLLSGQASFMYDRDDADQTYAQLLIGSPWRRSGVGLSFSYFDAGQLDIFDGVTHSIVDLQTDMALTLSGARKFGSVSMGMSGKYLSSELGDQASATAFSGDLGMQLQLDSRLLLGAAVQNIGTKLTYVERANNLPRLGRAGVAVTLSPRHKTRFFFDEAYFMNEAELQHALALESWLGPLALRAGYKKKSSLSEFTIGTGFALNRISIDFAMGFGKSRNTQQLLNVNLMFGPGVREKEVVASKELKKELMVEPPVTEKRQRLGGDEKIDSKNSRKNYKFIVVKKGDTLALIAHRMYGNSDLWKKIFNANRDILNRPNDLRVGQKLLIPDYYQ